MNAGKQRELYEQQMAAQRAQSPPPPTPPTSAAPDDDELDFDGRTYSHIQDGKRLGEQYRNVFAYMSDGLVHKLDQIRKDTGYPEGSIGARCRDTRKAKFGSFNMKCWRAEHGKGTWLYCLLPGEWDGEKKPPQEWLDEWEKAGRPIGKRDA